MLPPSATQMQTGLMLHGLQSVLDDVQMRKRGAEGAFKRPDAVAVGDPELLEIVYEFRERDDGEVTHAQAFRRMEVGVSMARAHVPILVGVTTVVRAGATRLGVVRSLAREDGSNMGNERTLVRAGGEIVDAVKPLARTDETTVDTGSEMVRADERSMEFVKTMVRANASAVGNGKSLVCADITPRSPTATRQSEK